MAEAVALACTVLTLATALKDLVELGIKLKGFCNQVAKNDGELARLCDQIQSDLQGLETLYKSNSDVLDHESSARDSVTRLIMKLREATNKVKSLVESQPKSRYQIGSWLKSLFGASEVANAIKDLKDDISVCYRSFQLLATIRIESEACKIQATGEETHVAVQRLLVLITEQRQGIQAMKSNVQQQLQVYDPSTVVSSTETTTLQKVSRSRTLDHLEYQLSNIGIEVSKRTTADFPDLPIRPVKPFVHHWPVLSYHILPEKRHRSLLRRVLDLLGGLEEDAIAIDDHASALNSLGDIFLSMNMCDEAAVVYTWAIDLYRTLADLRPLDFTPYLAEATCSRHWTGDIDTAITILHPMVGPNSSPDVHCQFVFQLSQGLVFSQWSVSSGDRLEDAKHVLETIEPIVRGEVRFDELFTLLDDDTNLIDHLASLLTQWDINAQTKADGFITSDFELIGADAFLYTYSKALQCAFQVHYDSGFVNSAQEFLLKAAIINTYLATTYPETSLEARLAYFLTLLPESISPPEKKLLFLEESVKIYRKASGYDPKLYTDRWLYALCKKASWLQVQGRQDEARQTWREMLELSPAALANPAQGGQLIESNTNSNTLQSDFQVEDVVVTVHIQSVQIYHQIFHTYSWQQARACQALATDYHLAGRVTPALRLAELAVQQVQALTLQDPSDYTGELASTLISWINIISSSTSSNSQFAIEKVKAILDQYDNLVRSNINNFAHYTSLTSPLINGVDNPSIAKFVSHDVVERLCRLAKGYPEAEGINLFLLEWQKYHGLLLARCDLLDEAVTCLETLRDECYHLANGDKKVGSGYINLLLHLGIVLKDRGDLKEAREVLRTAVETGEQLISLGDNTAWWCSIALSHQAEIAAYLGEDALALKLSTECLSFAESIFLSHIIEDDLTFLPPHSRQLAINERHEEALLVAEGLACRVKEKTLIFSSLDRHWFIWPSEHLRTWAACLADAHKISEALVIAKQAVEEARRVKGVTLAGLRKTAENLYGIALWTLGHIQLFSNDRDAALITLEEAKELWKQRSKVRKFDLRNLGLVLWALAKLYCLLGRYEDGIAANRKLMKILNGLEYSNPTMHLVVSVAIDRERRRPSWVKLLESVAEELRGGHLEEVVPIMKKT